MAKGNIFVDRKVTALAISVLIVLVGFIALQTLPVEQYPDIAPPTIYVNATYTGADPGTIMSSVNTPLEESINGVENMDYMISNAYSNNTAEIVIYFKQGSDPDMACVNVQNRVSKALGQLPAAVTQIGVTVEKRQTSMLQINSLYSTDGKFDADFLANYVDINIKPRLLRIQGIGNVTNLGNTYSLRVWMKPDIMARYNLTPNDVFSALNSQNIVAATGFLGEKSANTLQYTLEYKGRLKTIAEFEEIVIRANQDGEVLHMRDVADIELGASSYSFLSETNGQPGVLFIMYQTAGANSTKINAEIGKLYKSIEKELPPGVKLITLQSSDDFLYAAMDSVIETLIIAILLVILVVFFFLQDFKATIIPSISIIVSLMGTFAVIKIAGFSLNILTLFALVLVIGTVVDDAIVVVEAVMAKLDVGYKNVHQATRDALSEVSSAVFSCSMVFMAVFIPVTFMPGTSGTFFTQCGITMATAVGLSCLNALTMCPALCAMLMRPKQEAEGKGLGYYTKLAYEASYTAVFHKYNNALPKFVKRPALAWTLLIVSGVVLGWLMKSMPSGLVPQEDQGVVMMDVSTNPGSTLHETNEIANQVMERIKTIPEITNYCCASGFGLISGYGSNHVTVIAKLKHWEERSGKKHSIQSVIGRIYAYTEDIKEARVIAFQMPQIPGYGSSNCIELIMEDQRGEGMTALKGVTDEFLGKLGQRPEIALAMSTYSESYPKYKVDVNAAQCDRAGILPSDVLNTLGAFCGGAYIGDYNQYGKVYRVMVAASPEYRLAPSSLANIFVKVGDKMAPIAQFVTLTKSAGSDSQKRFNLYNSITCQISPAAGFTDGDAQTAIREVANQVLPVGYGYDYGGMSRELSNNSESSLTGIIYLICVFLIYLILATLYESWWIPFAVLLSVPFGLMGSFLCSDLVGLDNNIYLQTGVIMLIGLLAKTAILITEFAVDKHKQGMEVTEAALEACKDRLRPILMTVLTMIVGMIPLIIEGGAGANGNRSLAIGVVGGMSLGIVAILFVVPVFYIAFQKIHDKLHKVEVQDEK